jgi:hypothetical protein
VIVSARLIVSATVSAASIGAVVASACLTERDAMIARPPNVVVELPPRKTAAVCLAPRGPVELVEGRVPDDAVEILRSTTKTSDEHVALRAHEEAAKRAAKELCADGVSVLNATESLRGVASTNISFWRRVEVTDGGP